MEGDVSNPIGPGGYMSEDELDEDLQPLTNADFRKLMMTPAAPSQRKSSEKKERVRIEHDTEAMRARREKKMRYAKLRKIQEERDKELASKYRDRAEERRRVQEGDLTSQEVQSTTADYKAVAPVAPGQNDDFTERRKQIIQDSKYLGGDMEHTHLVKGLDYALLEKVRGEISVKEQEEVVLEQALKPGVKETTETEGETIQFKTRLGRNVYRMVQTARNTKVERNELFLPRRMCYVVELDEEVDTDIPTTVIRSKADCPSLESATTLTTNDIVINKLTDILSYLRHGRKEKRRLKKAKVKEDTKGEGKMQDESIYGDIGEYRSATNSSGRERGSRDERRHRQRDDRREDRRRDKSYFDGVKEERKDERPKQSTKEMVRAINDRFGGSQKSEWAAVNQERNADQPQGKTKEEAKLLKKLKEVGVKGYNECYPGMAETMDAIDDSDDEADYTKMDMGNKKGPVSRWDFENQDDYSNYMDRKEALPKAAFQYGVKMSDGRRTRRTGPKDEKKELDREWQKIQNLITKRKGDGQAGDGAWKKPKY